MKNLNELFESILDSDSLDNEVELGVTEETTLKLGSKWATKMRGYNYKPGTDSCGNPIDIGDWVLVWGGLNPEIGRIIKTDWSVRNGSNIGVMTQDKPLDYYRNPRTGELNCNARADHAFKLDPKSALIILRELCGH